MDPGTFSAVYYNGLSSKPHAVSVDMDAPENGIRIIDSGNTLMWAYTDLLVEGNHASFTIRNKIYPSQSLYVNDPETYTRLIAIRKQVGTFGFYDRLVHSPTWAKWAMFLSIIVLSVTAYLLWMPSLAAKAVTLMPLSVDKEIGNSFFDSFIEPTLDIDSNATVLLNKLTADLAYKGEIPVKIIVNKTSEVNAFALPNGIIIVNTGIIDKTKTPAELLAVIGHEMTHVSERHSIRMMTRNLTNALLVSIVFSDVNGIAQILIDNSRQLQSLSFSREYEERADKGSFELLKQARISPEGLTDLFKTLDKEAKRNAGVPEFLQTHPLSKKRVKAMQQLIDKYPYEVMKSTAYIDSIYHELKQEAQPAQKENK